MDVHVAEEIEVVRNRLMEFAKGALAEWEADLPVGPESFMPPVAFAEFPGNSLAVVDMAELDVMAQRRYLEEFTAFHNAVAVVVVNEVFTAYPDTPEEQKEIERLIAARQLQTHPARREELQMFFEHVHPEHVLELETCTITRAEDGARTLGPWEQTLKVHLPYPGFKRYFAPRKEG